MWPSVGQREAIILVAALGVFGFAFVDNAAHFGGLVGGVFLGWLFLRGRMSSDENLPPNRLTQPHGLRYVVSLV